MKAFEANLSGIPAHSALACTTQTALAAQTEALLVALNWKLCSRHAFNVLCPLVSTRPIQIPQKSTGTSSTPRAQRGWLVLSSSCFPAQTCSSCAYCSLMQRVPQRRGEGVPQGTDNILVLLAVTTAREHLKET